MAHSVQSSNIVALDCEMVGIGPDDEDSALARVSIVDYNLKVIYDEFVKPDLPVVDYRTAVSGVRPMDLRHAKSEAEAVRDVKRILAGKILVGHSLENDFQVLGFVHPRADTRDTQIHFRGGRRYPPSLKYLASDKLGVDIQRGEHSSVEDARICMQIYKQHQERWEKQYQNRRRR